MSSSSLALNKRIIRAGAGAGKTTTLINTFIDFSLDFNRRYGRWPRVVLTTFTRKATQEIRERIFARAIEFGDEDLFRFVSRRSQVQISTIHGVLSLLLKQQGRKIGLTPDFEIIDDKTASEQRRRIIRKLLQQNEIWASLIAGPMRLRHLEESLAEYSHLRMCGFRPKPLTKEDLEASILSQLKENRQKLVNFLSQVEEVATGKMLELVSIWKNPPLVQNVEDSESYFAHLYAGLRIGRRPSVRNRDDINEILSELWEFAKQADPETGAAPYEMTADFVKNVGEINHLFSDLAEHFHLTSIEEKIRRGQITISDLETLSYFLLEQQKESFLAFASSWDFWMVDEYQDNSPLQVKLLDALIADRPCFYVGDPQQSIYLFRGARAEIFQQKFTEIENQGGVATFQMKNYRSRPELLNLFNAWFANRSGFSPMEPRDRAEGDLDIQTWPAADVIYEERESGAAEAAVFRIQELISAGVQPESICLLAAKRNHLSSVQKIAKLCGVPVIVHSAGGFSKRREILDIAALLKVMVNPHDDQSLLEVFRSPWLHIPDSILVSLCGEKKESSLWSWLSVKGENAPKAFLRLKEYVFRARSEGFSQCFVSALCGLGVFDWCWTVDPSGRREANLWKFVTRLKDKEREPGFNFLDFVSDLEERTIDIDEDAEGDATPVVEPARVNMMTVHASKGLQFDHVILYRPDSKRKPERIKLFSFREKDGIFTFGSEDPHSGTLKFPELSKEVARELNARKIAEMDRVLYVALTRARQTVSLVIQDKFRSDSWGFCPLTEGDQDLQGIPCRVRRGQFVPSKAEIAPHTVGEIPPRWGQVVDSQASGTTSVTKLLDSTVNGLRIPMTVRLEFLKGAVAGSDAHRVFEALRFGINEEKFESGLRKAISWLRGLKDPPLSEILRSGFAEWGFAVKLDDGKLLQGQIDLWAVVQNHLWILDYKTGSSENVEKAMPQMRAYAWALVRMKKAGSTNMIRLAALYPFEEKVFVDRIDIKELIESTPVQ
ncbi:MAG: UvrD-helicase domain-containing protein [Bdellovibrionaceae bacterium]|nr:UvrD-helicase domain-containing protein [Pseudobdellovibrionaceae bacterium]